MAHRGRVALLTLALVHAWSAPPSAWAFQTRTHRELNESAGGISRAGAYLADELGIADGLSAVFSKRSLTDWLRDGGAAEDKYFGNETPLGALNRSKHHFHNPLREWDVAGLDGRCFGFAFRGLASVRWAQTPEQPALAGQSATWADARRSFFDALTLETKGAREDAFAVLFRTLGQQMHLIGDLAVPAHARNDIHCLPDRFEVWAGEDEALELVRGLRAGDVVKPDTSIFEISPPGGEGVAIVPVARLSDSDQYLGSNPDVTLLPTIGLAEYTSANFFSGKTIFSPDFPFPARTSVELLDPPETAPKVGELRRYLTKVRDGAPVRHLAVPSALHEFLPDALRDKKLGLDEKVLGDYGNLLLPRAVGYSAALLDYFFRGKLDVDLVTGGTGLRLVGTNASRDALGAGTLTVFADDTDGLRRPAGAAIALERVEPGDALPPVAVTPPAGAERFVAVYTGGLGEERLADTFKGAVTGRVLGGYRVEEVFSDGTRWNLRTPKGIFALPILRSDIVDLRWGDADNTLVGRTAFGTTGQPNTLRAYRLNRPLGSVDVPLVTAPGGGQQVDVHQIDEQTFPFGLDAGRLQLNSRIDYRQYLISVVRTKVFKNSALVSDTYGDGKVERVVSGSASATFDWRLTLDLAKFNAFRARPYLWQLQQIGLTSGGHMVALVRIRLTQVDTSLPESFAIFPTKRLVWCGGAKCSSPPGVEDGPTTGVRYDFGRGATNHWALVDVSEGRIVYSTAEEGVVVDNTFETTQFQESTIGPFNGLVGTEIVHRVEDDDSFYPVDFQNNVRLGALCDPPGEFYDVGRVDLSFGIVTAAASQYRSELAQTEFAPFLEHRRSEDAACLSNILGDSPKVFITVASDESRVYLNDAIGALRVSDGSERVALLFDLGQGLAPSFHGSRARVVAWDPLAPSASLRHEILAGDNWQLITAARGVGVISGSNSPALTAVPLEGDQPATVFPMSLGEVFNFRGLSPSFLYNVQDLRFYRYQPSLLPTALPATLADGGSAAGDYHAVRLP